MSVQILGIVLFSYDGRARELPLQPGRVNIVPGRRKLGNRRLSTLSTTALVPASVGSPRDRFADVSRGSVFASNSARARHSSPVDAQGHAPSPAKSASSSSAIKSPSQQRAYFDKPRIPRGSSACFRTYPELATTSTSPRRVRHGPHSRPLLGMPSPSAFSLRTRSLDASSSSMALVTTSLPKALRTFSRTSLVQLTMSTSESARN